MSCGKDTFCLDCLRQVLIKLCNVGAFPEVETRNFCPYSKQKPQVWRCAFYEKTPRDILMAMGRDLTQLHDPNQHVGNLTEWDLVQQLVKTLQKMIDANEICHHGSIAAYIGNLKFPAAWIIDFQPQPVKCTFLRCGGRRMNIVEWVETIRQLFVSMEDQLKFKGIKKKDENATCTQVVDEPK